MHQPQRSQESFVLITYVAIDLKGPIATSGSTIQDALLALNFKLLLFDRCGGISSFVCKLK